MKKLLTFLMSMSMTLVLAGCGNGAGNTATTSNTASTPEVKPQSASVAAVESVETKEKATDGELTELNVAYMPNYASLWHLLTGIDKGYFEEEGLKINLIEFADGPSEIAAMEGGSVDVAYIGHGAHRLAINGSADIIAPSSVHNTDKIIVLTSKGIEDIKDLKGKKVAYNAGSSSETALNGALASAGLTMDDIDPYEMDATNMVAAMMSGSVDACTAWNPYDSQILDNVKDAKQIEFSTDSVNLSSFIALPSYVEKNHDLLVRFNRALFKAMQFAAKEENWDYAVGLYAKQTAKDEEAAKVETGDAKWFSEDDIKKGVEDGSMADLYKQQQQMFIDSGDVEKERPVDEYVKFDLIKEALK
ncbi:MAG: ABC transporter substrate-binding protein [Peptoniphilaceae bacterium]|nr:ABC transporter substrate-binding protein [Peptoniphilaceae bacterium]MDD7382796.1 ABC transporter substrate-binding protein [Peptoniphilaceae bacterium]MDY3737954.1 ABC transporter substrate-binding protein [Peptoniphilaceae bacterium]